MKRERKRLSDLPEYSNYLHEAATKGLIVDSDSTKLLVIDGDFKHQDVYTVNVPFYWGSAHMDVRQVHF